MQAIYRYSAARVSKRLIDEVAACLREAAAPTSRVLIYSALRISVGADLRVWPRVGFTHHRRGRTRRSAPTVHAIEIRSKSGHATLVHRGGSPTVREGVDIECPRPPSRSGYRHAARNCTNLGCSDLEVKIQSPCHPNNLVSRRPGVESKEFKRSRASDILFG